MDYKIIFDTEAVWINHGVDLNEVFHSSILVASEFLQKHDVNNAKIYLPEMVIEERIQQKIENTKSLLNKVNNGLGRLSKIGYKFEKPKITKKLETHFRKLSKDFLSKNKIGTLKMPRLKSKEIVDRAIKKIKPFNDKMSGFKDTIILLSIIADAKISKDVECILVTNNKKDFSDKVIAEFNQVTGKKLYIVGNVDELKVLLDDLVPLRLKLKQLHAGIKNEIEGEIGTIMQELNKTIQPSPRGGTTFDSFGISDYPHLTYASFHEEKEEVVGYNFLDLKIENIAEGEGKIFHVEGTITVEPKYKNEKSPDSRISFHVELRNQSETSNFSLWFDSENHKISRVHFLSLGGIGNARYVGWDNSALDRWRDIWPG